MMPDIPFNFQQSLPVLNKDPLILFVPKHRNVPTNSYFSFAGVVLSTTPQWNQKTRCLLDLLVVPRGEFLFDQKTSATCWFSALDFAMDPNATTAGRRKAASQSKAWRHPRSSHWMIHWIGLFQFSTTSTKVAKTFRWIPYWAWDSNVWRNPSFETIPSRLFRF